MCLLWLPGVHYAINAHYVCDCSQRVMAGNSPGGTAVWCMQWLHFSLFISQQHEPRLQLGPTTQAVRMLAS